MRIALCFWGITRSLKYTYPTIDKNILQVLKDNNIDYHIFMHTYKLDYVTSPRMGEDNVRLDFKEYKLLCNIENTHTFQYHYQNKIEKKLNCEQYYTKPDPWPKHNHMSAKFFILSQYSKKRATLMMKKSQVEFDAVVFLRPDMQYIDPFPVDHLNQLDDETCFFPNWHLYGSRDYKVNDRFQITSKKFADILGTSFDMLLDYSKTNVINSEFFMSHICHKYAIQCKYIDNFLFLRTRADGRVPTVDKKLLRQERGPGNYSS